jgi:hypothetical protein
MGKLMLILGIVLMAVAIGLLLFMTTQIQSERFGDLMTRLYCTEKEHFTVWQGAYEYDSFRRSGGYPTAFYCETEDGEQRDISGNVVLAMIVSFVVPFLLGLFMLMGGIGLMVKRGVSGLMKNVGNLQTVRSQSTVIDLRQGTTGYDSLAPDMKQMVDSLRQGFGGQVGSQVNVNHGGSLTERLSQLEDAYRQGLISKDEYDKARAAILDKMDD